CRDLFIRSSLICLVEATYPPKHPKPLLKLLVCTSMSLLTPRYEGMPEKRDDDDADASPNIKSPWASSTTVIAFCAFAILHICCKFEMSPSILKSPSVTTIFFLPQDSASIKCSSCSVSLWRKTLIFAPLSLQPSTML